MSQAEATIIMRLPPELKDLYQALCKSRGVTVSDSLRKFMIEEIGRATEPLNTPKRAPKPKKAAKPQKQAKKTHKANSSFDDAFSKALKR